jgi:uncharacterized protein (TIGR02058 family)
MALKRFVIEMGTGIDQHGQDSTKAATRAIEDAVRRICLAGIMEILRICDPNEMIVHVLIGCPNPTSVKKDIILNALPFGRKQIEVIEGGLLVPIAFSEAFGDKTADVVMANAAITIFVDMGKVLKAWEKEPI